MKSKRSKSVEEKEEIRDAKEASATVISIIYILGLVLLFGVTTTALPSLSFQNEILYKWLPFVAFMVLTMVFSFFATIILLPSSYKKINALLSVTISLFVVMIALTIIFAMFPAFLSLLLEILFIVYLASIVADAIYIISI